MSTSDPHASTAFSKDRLRDALDGIATHHNFAGWNEIVPLDPEIAVNGVGKIRLPLSDEQASQIISAARPVSAEDEAATQDNVWELDPQNLTITAQKQWNESLQSLLMAISKTMGVSRRVLRADLQKLSIWGKGAVFKGNALSDGIPHKFGTLVISLPSQHQGGDVIMSSLESGYRWALTYNLVTTVPLEKPLESPEVGCEPLHSVLKSWTSIDSSAELRPLIYALDDNYTGTNMSSIILEARDKACLEQLLHVSHDLDFHIFYAKLELEAGTDAEDVETYDASQALGIDSENDMDDETEEYYGHWDKYDAFCALENDGEDSGTLKAEHVCDSKGNEVLSSLEVDEDRIMHDYASVGHSGDEIKSEDFVSRYNGASVLIIVPPKALIPFFAASGCDRFGHSTDPRPLGIINYYIDKCQSSNSASALDGLLHMLKKTETPYPLDWAGYTALAERVYKLAMIHCGSELMDWITRATPSIPAAVLSWSRTQYESSAISLERLDQGFSTIIKTRKSLSGQYQVINAFQTDVGQNDGLLRLMTNSPTKTIGSCDWGLSRLYEDGLALYQIALCADGSLEILKSRSVLNRPFYDFETNQYPSIVPKLVGTCGERTDFMLGFMQGWSEDMPRNEIELADSQAIYENLVQLIVRNISIRLLATDSAYAYADEEIQDNKRARKNRNSQSPVKFVIPYQALEHFAVTLFQPSLAEQREIFFKKLAAEVKFITPASFENLWVPLLQPLLRNSEELGFSISDRSWQQLYQDILESFLLSYVGKALPDPSLVRTPVPCSCDDCSQLNLFLLDPAQKSRTFNQFIFGRLAHVLDKFTDTRTDCKFIGKPHYVFSKIEDGITEGVRTRRATRKRKAEGSLGAFDTEKLRTILAEKYEGIATMSFLDHPGTLHNQITSATSNPTVTSSESVSIPSRLVSRAEIQYPVAGTKRKKIETIDLTTEDD
ncbi:hypothetical protein F4808DRAFT_474424 [Astrocystis sublimbata]|nr:hypothetical protein F4808DRAFT_474424 [Astrocystis sublimbata]